MGAHSLEKVKVHFESDHLLNLGLGVHLYFIYMSRAEPFWLTFQFQFKRFFIVNPQIKKIYNGKTFHGHWYNALRAKLTRRKWQYTWNFNNVCKREGAHVRGFVSTFVFIILNRYVQAHPCFFNAFLWSLFLLWNKLFKSKVSNTI